jgi:hypothetical protein
MKVRARIATRTSTPLWALAVALSAISLLLILPR